MQNGLRMSETELAVKKLIIEALKLEDIAAEEIASDEPLFGSGLGLDSIDALELGVAIRRQ
jgi:acyl carrier protein